MCVANRKDKFIWNMIGSMCSALMSLLLLIMVNQMVGERVGGIFAFAYSHAQLIYYIGTLEVRPIQSTDVTKKYSFSQYFSLRIISCIVMVILGVFYVFFTSGDRLKKSIILWLTIYKVIEAMEDTFTSMYQQHDRIDLSGKLMTIRIVSSMACFIAVLFAVGRVDWACMGMVVCGITSLLTYNIKIWKNFKDAKIKWCINRETLEILIGCFPLFVSVFVMLYISNAPKYAIDRYCSDEIQNMYSILFMPAFVINLFSTFVLRPLLTTMANMWNGNKIKEFSHNLSRMFILIVVISFGAIAGAYLFGISILELLYGVDLQEQRAVLLLVMVYGGLNAINILLYDMIAVTREQRWLLIAYLVSLVTIIPLAPTLVRAHGILGAITSSIVSIGVLDSILFFIIIRVIHKKINCWR